MGPHRESFPSSLVSWLNFTPFCLWPSVVENGPVNWEQILAKSHLAYIRFTVSVCSSLIPGHQIIFLLYNRHGSRSLLFIYGQTFVRRRQCSMYGMTLWESHIESPVSPVHVLGECSAKQAHEASVKRVLTDCSGWTPIWPQTIPSPDTHALHLSVGRTCDFLLAMECDKDDGMSLLWLYYYTSDFILLADSL
jgi:hypothetical protein